LSSADLFWLSGWGPAVCSAAEFFCLIQRQRDIQFVETECLAKVKISRVSFYYPTL